MDSSPPKRRKTSYQWASVGTGDIMGQAAGHNLPRVRAAAKDESKELTPVIAKDEKVFSDLTHSRKEILAETEEDMIKTAEAHANAVAQHQHWKKKRQEYKKLLDPDYVPKEDGTKPAKPFDKSNLNGMPQHLLDAYQNVSKRKKEWKATRDKAGELKRKLSDVFNATANTEILRASEVPLATLDPQNTKLYVLGHGTAAANYISPTRSRADAIPLKTVASDLAKSGLNPKLEDVRLVSCHSADITKPTDFNPGFDPPAAVGNLRAPAQTFANELAKQGFHNARVAGYQGIGQVNPRGLHQTRKPGEGFPASSEIRAKEVRKVFTPEK